jgi:hypothetical protein
MKKIFLLGVFTSVLSIGFSQSIDKIITKEEVTRIETTLASDEMEGRKPGTPGIQKAADFISAEFKKAGLQTFAGANGYLQEFKIMNAKFNGLTASFDGVSVDAKNVVVFTNQSQLSVNEKSGYEIVSVTNAQTANSDFTKYIQSGKNYIVLVDTSANRSFSRLIRMKSAMFPMQNNIVFVLGQTKPSTFNIEATHKIEETKYMNVVGVIPGKSKKDEYVIFSGHYDHLGYGKAVNGDSLYNGANDDAAGTTAMIMLSKYFSAVKNNERTIVFAAFTAEESGGFGATYFSRQFDPAKVVAMFNIEMVGTDSKWGTNSAYITGYEKTDMGKILEKNLEGSQFKFYPDPYPTQQLFYRSDNATLARLGVPAHTISTAKMENAPNNEPHYHKPSDHIETLDMQNMTEIIKAIALSSKTIIAGKDTPSRVDATQLR